MGVILAFLLVITQERFEVSPREYIVSLESPVRVEIFPLRVEKFPLERGFYKFGKPGIAERVFEKEREETLSNIPYRISDTSFFRGEKVGRLIFYPVRFDPKESVLVYESLRVSYEKPKGKEMRRKSFENFFARSNQWFKCKVDSQGIYKITGRELERAGFSLSGISPDGFRLYNIGEFSPPVSYPETMVEVPIYVYTGGDSSFDPDDYILFYGEGVSRWDKYLDNYFEDIFSLYNYYFLTYSNEKGKRMEILPQRREGGPPLRPESKVHFEKENLCPARGGTLWLWDMIVKRSDEERIRREYSLPLPEGESLMGISLRVFSQNRGFSLKLFFNSILLDSQFIPSANLPDGKVIRVERVLPMAEECRVEIEIGGGGDLTVFLDWIEVTFLPKRQVEKPLPLRVKRKGDYFFQGKEDCILLDITERFNPKILPYIRNGDSSFFSIPDSEPKVLFLAPLSRFRRVLNIEEKSELSYSYLSNLSADFIFVAPKAFRKLAYLFADYRRRRSQIRTGVALLEDLYDFYLFGIQEPYALKRFFQTKCPDYALLLGDGNYDYRGIFAPKGPEIPPYEFGAGFSYEVYERYPLALDSWFADFEDSPMPVYPDFILGRIPIRDEREGMAYLQKLESYEKKIGDYRVRFLFAADDEYLGDPYNPDNCGLGVHIRSCERLEEVLPRYFAVKKVYLTEYPLSQVRDKPEARKAFSDCLSDGVFGVVYFGHGAGFRLAHEQLLNIEDVFNLKTRGQFPFGFFGSCGVGRFDDFEVGRYREAIAEDLVRNPDGFIATIASTKATSPSTNEVICSSLLSSFFSGRSLGESFLTSSLYDVSYHFFGDPSLLSLLPQEKEGIRVTSPLRPKENASLSCSLGVKEERVFSSRVFYGKRFRRYTSTVFFDGNPYIFRIDYTLPGFEVLKEKRKEEFSFFSLNFIPPAGIPLSPVGDENNFYQEIPNTARALSFFVTRSCSAFCIVWDSLVRDTVPGEGVDTSGPQLRLFAEGRELSSLETLPKTFLLTGEFSDPSGVYISPYLFYPRLFIESDEINLSGILEGDYRRLKFRLPLTLSSEKNHLKLVCYDNFLNRSERLFQIITSLSPHLKIISPLAYYKRGLLTFNFTLSHPAEVKIKVWTISGRFLESFSLYLPSGRQVVSFPIVLPKGVYLFRITGRSFSLDEEVSLDEKFLVF